MSMSPLSAASNMITSAQYKAANATQNIASQPLQAEKVEGVQAVKTEDYVKSLMNLNEARVETSAAAKLIENEEKTIGRFLDVMA